MKYISKLSLQNEQEVFLFSEYIPEKKLSVKILNLLDNEGFYGHVSDQDLRSQAANIRLTFSNFLTKAKNALFCTNQGDVKFIYNLEKRNSVYAFEWKSIDCEETVIKLGYVPVNKLNFTTICSDVFTSLSQELLSANQINTDLKASLEVSENKRSELTELLSNATHAKKNLEKELYSKFIVLLNAKKRKICELKSNVTKNDSNDSGKIKKSKKKTEIECHALFFSDDSNEVDVPDNPGPSKYKNHLFVDDHSPALNITPSKMRNRKVVVGEIARKKINLLPKTQEKEIINTQYESDDDLFKHF